MPLPLPILQINYLESIGNRICMPLVKTLWKDFRFLGAVMKNCQVYPGLPSIIIFKTDAPSLVILDMNFITVPESTQKMALNFSTMVSSFITHLNSLESDIANLALCQECDKLHIALS